MATANFHARIERIQKSQAQMQAQPIPTKPVRTPGVASIAQSMERPRKRNAITEHLISLATGALLGGLGAVGQFGLSMEGALWGPGTDWHDMAVYPVLGSLLLAPLLLVLSLFLVNKRPGFALFTLGYLSTIMLPFFI